MTRRTLSIKRCPVVTIIETGRDRATAEETPNAPILGVRAQRSEKERVGEHFCVGGGGRATVIQHSLAGFRALSRLFDGIAGNCCLQG
jgi:hypothetical protein